MILEKSLGISRNITDRRIDSYDLLSFSFPPMFGGAKSVVKRGGLPFDLYKNQGVQSSEGPERSSLFKR